MMAAVNNFYLEFHHDKVTFYHNDFDEEEGYPVLSCSLHIFKTALIAWNAFLQLPKKYSFGGGNRD